MKNKQPSAHTLSVPATQALHCPYWCTNARKCNLVKDGIYLPLRSHIVTYCTSENYPTCRHYHMLLPANDHQDQLSTGKVNRRSATRFPHHQIFRFSETNAIHPTCPYPAEEGWTIDISKTGIRFSNYKPLPVDSLISFSIEGNNSLNIHSGLGKVVWSKQPSPSALFHTGITFVH